jgi:threonine dehydratase
MTTPVKIQDAYQRISSRIRKTPVISLPGERLGLAANTLTFKLESLQVTGSFKPRGVFNTVLSQDKLPEAGLIAASGGNHGAAVAYAARELGLNCEI